MATERKPLKTITYKQDSLPEYLWKIWRHRSLAITFARRDLKIKYAQTSLGLAWTIIQPITAVIVFSLFFSLLLDVSNPYPYVLFVMSGVLVWGLYQYIFSQGSICLIQNQDLIRKLYFPKILLLVSKALVGLVEFGISLVLLAVLMLFFRVPVSWHIIFFPLIILCVMMFSLGMSMFLSAATVRNRDLNHFVPFLLNFGIWLTPVFYPVSLIPEQYSNWVFLNPMACCVQLVRYSVLPEVFNPYALLGVPVCVLVFVGGLMFFRRAEASIADAI